MVKLIEKRMCKRAWVGLFVMTIAFVTVGSVGIVWMRQQVSNYARQGSAMELKLAQVNRSLAAVQGQIALIHNPQAMQKTLAQAGGSAKQSKVVWIQDASLSAERAQVAYAPARKSALYVAQNHRT